MKGLVGDRSSTKVHVRDREALFCFPSEEFKKANIIFGHELRTHTEINSLYQARASK